MRLIRVDFTSITVPLVPTCNLRWWMVVYIYHIEIDVYTTRPFKHIPPRKRIKRSFYLELQKI